MPRKSLIRIANEQVPFARAASWAGLRPASERGSRDDCRACGSRGAQRSYPDHGWCFDCRTYFTPVSLLALVWEMDYDDAAMKALDRIGYVPLSYAARWEHALREPDPDAGQLAEALVIWCESQDPDWGRRQYAEDVSYRLARCHGLLGRVRTEADCAAWLARCKQVMARVLPAVPAELPDLS